MALSSPDNIRVRIAPSPTGNLHIGTARTALFNYLYAKHTGGKFILRIEDTDLERSESQYVDDIYNGLKSLGLNWDEGPDVGGEYGPYVQSERLEIYPQYAQKLLDNGTAYYCYCTQAELDVEKERAIEAKQPYVYSRRCLNPAEAEALKADPERKPVIRFKIPDSPTKVVIPDIIRGDVEFETALIGDFVLVKSNGIASYNFAVVVDDITMKISHVIRGEDHISNTPKQMLLYDALGATQPLFAHVGMILAPDRSKLSKRHGATSVAEFIRQGYLPEAFTNFISLLGWSPAEGEEIGDLKRFGEEFTLERVAHSPAVFDVEKLNWLNGMYIRTLPLDDLSDRAKCFLQGFDLSVYSEEQLQLLLEAVREPLVTLQELPDAVSYFFGDDVTVPETIQTDVLNLPESQQVLEAFQITGFQTLDFASPETLAAGVKEFANGLKPLKMKSVMWAIRAAVSGRVQGADLGKILYLLGSNRIEHRVKKALQTAAVS